MNFRSSKMCLLTLCGVIASCASMSAAINVSGKPTKNKQSPAGDVTYPKCDATAKSCDWLSSNHDHCNTRNNPCEVSIDVTNAANLQRVWHNQDSPVQTLDSAPVVSNGIVYYADTDGNVFARNMSDASLVWQQTLDDSTESGILVTNNRLYVATNALTLYSLDLSSGKVIWTQVVDPAAKATGQAAVLAGITLADNYLIVPTTNDDTAEAQPNPTVRGSLNAFDPDTGKLLWRYIPSPAPGGTGIGFWSTPAIDTDRKVLYIGSANATLPPAGNLSDALLAIDYRKGALLWSVQFTPNDVWGYNYPNGPDKDCGASPNLFSIKTATGSQDLVGVASKSGVYVAVNRDTGKTVWSNQLTPTPAKYANPSACLDGTSLYVIANSDPYGLMTGPLSIAAANGNYQAAALTIFYLKNGLLCTIKALDPTNGTEKWSITVPQSVCSGGLTVANGVLYYGDYNGVLRAFNASNGVQLFQAQTDLVTLPIPNFPPINAPIGGGIVVDNGNVFVGSGFAGFIPGGVDCYRLPSVSK